MHDYQSDLLGFEMLEFLSDEISTIDNTCINFNNLNSYLSFFSSSEWIKGYIEVYKPEKILLIKVKNCNCGNYVLLEKKKKSITFLGTPFNDFNTLYPNGYCDNHRWGDLFSYLSKKYEKVSLDNLAPDGTDKILNKIEQAKVTPTKCVKIDLSQKNPSNHFVSPKIIRMYKRHHSVKYFLTSYNIDQQLSGKNLDFILEHRLNKLQERNAETNNNASLNLNFSIFIRLLTSYTSLRENIIISSAIFEDKIIAAGLFFEHKKSVLYYLRSHIDMGTRISPGLLLDFYAISKFDEMKYLTFDFTRGDEGYKYRLGGKDYYLANLIL